MPQTWDYEAELPAGMTHCVQVQSNSEFADFNVRIRDEEGRIVAEDLGPEAGAECNFSTGSSGKFVIQVELVSGQSGFSLNVSSKTQPSDLDARDADESTQDTNNEDPSIAESSGDSSILVDSKLTQTEIDELVEAHNRWRSRYGCEPLTWCNELASVAQDWANHLEPSMQMRHRSPNEFGENLFWCAGKAATPSEVVDAWGNEVEFYDEAQNNWWPKAGHFSQVVWQTTTKVGGGVVRRGAEELWVCNYSPRGNWTGQRPYPIDR